MKYDLIFICIVCMMNIVLYRGILVTFCDCQLFIDLIHHPKFLSRNLQNLIIYWSSVVLIKVQM